MSLLALLVLGSWSAAAEDAPAAAAEPKPAATAEDRLADQQHRIADRYARLEEILLRMAEVTAATDPRRSALLRQAVAQSKDRLIDAQFEQLANLLEKGQLSRALENQQTLDKDLRALLVLLMSENRADQLEAEKARIREYIKQVERAIRQQRSLQGRTQGGGEPKLLTGEQGSLAEKTGRLADDMKKHDPSTNPGEQPERQPAPGEHPGQPPKPGDEESANPPSPGGSGKPPEGQPGQGSPPPQNQPGQQGPPSGEGQPGEQGSPRDQRQPQSSPPSNPAQKSLEAARDRMKEAQERLDAAKRAGAVEKQEEALRELEQAKAQLEEILRQLREEEIARMLAALEARFKKMLDMQRVVYTGTKRLDAVPAAQRTHGHEIEAGRLSDQEAQIVLEADKTLALLREDGTAVAFPEAVSQMRDDMQQIVFRLVRAKVDPTTQAIEEDVIAALEEMIEALQRAIQQQEQRQGQPPPSQGRPTDPALVDALAELKMIRALQMRVNRRTARYAQLLDGPQATDPELIEALRNLSEREARIYRITRDLEMGKNE
ncbi:MAG: hypothetical protein JW809_01460 [Pirellulales bacterium]|nr:hypothetical protein [Pirellulales bacterium]